MADVINDDDDKTLDQSNSGDAASTAVSEANENDDDQGAQGDAGDDQGGDQGSSEDGGDAGASEAEGDKKTRGEVRHERYIDKLASEIRQANDQSTRYTEEIFSPKPYQPIEFKPDEEYDPKDLENDRKTVADNRFAEGIQQGLHQGTNQVAKELWADRFDTDAERVTLKWDALNPDKDDTYDSKLESTLVQKYISFVGLEKNAQGQITIQKPNVRFRDFVQAEMQNLEDYAARRNSNSQQNIVKQAAQTGMRPGGQARVSKGDHGFDENDPAGSVARMTAKQYHELGGKEASDAYLKKRGLG